MLITGMQKYFGAIFAGVVAIFLGTFIWQNQKISTLSERLERLENDAPSQNPREQQASAPTIGGESKASVDRRVARIERALKTRRALSGRLPSEAFEEGDSLGALAEEVVQENRGVGKSEAKEIVQDLVRSEIERKEDERFEKRKQRRIERMLERIDALAEANDIDSGTQQKMVTIMTSEREQVSQLWREAREGNITRRDAHTKMSETRAETDENMKAILDDDQYAAYEADREQDRHRPRNREKKPERKKPADDDN